VHLKITVFTEESPERMATLVRNVEARCPVANLIKSAGVAVTIDWVTQPKIAAPQAEVEPQIVEKQP
jgi:uncharacterized OsmC-like protein